MLVILFCIIIWVSEILDIIIKIWQIFPVKEEKSTPIYITKELYNNRNDIHGLE